MRLSPLGVFGTNHFADSKCFGDSNPFAHSPFLFHFFTLSTNHCRCRLLSSSSTNRRLVTQSTALPNHLLVAFPSTYRRPRSSSTLPSRSPPGTSVVVFVHKQPFTSSCPSFKNFLHHESNQLFLRQSQSHVPGSHCRSFHYWPLATSSIVFCIDATLSELDHDTTDHALIAALATEKQRHSESLL